MPGRSIIVAAALAVSACQIVSDTPKKATVQDIEFMRGCWVQKTEPGGKILGFLRVLPRDEGTYLGQISRVEQDAMHPVLEFVLARDGSYVDVPYRGATLRMNADLPPPPAGTGAANFHANLPDQAEPAVFKAGGDAETLLIYPGGNIMSMMRYERDGCD